MCTSESESGVALLNQEREEMAQEGTAEGTEKTVRKGFPKINRLLATKRVWCH